ncbi:hypothetical protein [Streptosporangium lutulentum]|uniref:Uncharacterized protein n=1 Tax=Streptosporangium lutulentum TaxID=1461250 RepID=A0ABT9QAD6_9ACTN|nr:hypothetical protein [Streptosporangium lutulentum]MDP9843350.1 hypothetical protein [Streptosporangium lutulentum]
MTTIKTSPVELRGADLFWYAMDRIKEDGALRTAERPGRGSFYTRWHQGTWRCLVGDDRCGTALCLAGYVCYITRGKWLLTTDGNGNLFLNGKPHQPGNTYSEDLLLAEPDDNENWVRPWGDGSILAITAAERALRLLGLATSDSDEGDLFHGSNSYEDLELIGTELFGLRPAAA